MIRLIIILSMLLGAGPGDKKSGRRGNALMRQERFEDASAAYREGLAGLNAAEPDATHSGLLNNLGASLHRQGDFEGALNAFDAAVALAPEAASASRAAYNGGGASFRAEDLEAALGHYRQALLQDPGNEDARFNYEFVRRQMQEQENQNQDEQQEQDDENKEESEDQNQDGEPNEDQDEEQQDQEQNQDQNQDESDEQSDEQQQPPEQQDQLSQEEAERILEALENEEEQLLRQVQKMKTRPRRVEKDW
ncbi:MAG: Ca-activated chloride channel family protein [Rhodothermales bacterium]|jgi:Ca-activated chloride channel family protein